MAGTTVTCQADDGLPPESVTIEDDYLLVVDGTANHHHVTVHWCKDGTQTHVITVKGIRAAPTPIALAPDDTADGGK